VTSNTAQPSYPSLHLPTIPNHPFAFLLRKKAVWMEKIDVLQKGESCTRKMTPMINDGTSARRFDSTNLVRIPAY
jgi:hypothetical protein